MGNHQKILGRRDSSLLERAVWYMGLVGWALGPSLVGRLYGTSLLLVLLFYLGLSALSASLLAVAEKVRTLASPPTASFHFSLPCFYGIFRALYLEQGSK